MMEIQPAPFVVGCVAILGGVAVTVGGVVNVFKAAASQTWKATPARVTKMQMHEWSGDSTRNHTLELEYEYEIDGQRYRGTRPAYFPLNTKPLIEAFMSRHHGQTTAYYNPDQPAESVLERRGTKRFHTFFMGLIVIAVGCLLIFVATRGG